MQNAKKFVLLDQTTYDKRTSRELNFSTDVPNSNIIELVNDVLRQKSSDRAVGWREFASGLGSASVKISRDLITNNDSWKIIEGRSSSTDDVVNLSSIFQETTSARRSAATRQSRELTSTKRKPKRQQRYGTWVEY